MGEGFEVGNLLAQISAFIFAAFAVAGFIGGCVIGQFAKATRLELLGYVVLGFVGSAIAGFVSIKLDFRTNWEIAAAIVGGFLLPCVKLQLSNRASTQAR